MSTNAHTYSIGEVWKSGRNWRVQVPDGIQTTMTKREALALADNAVAQHRLQSAAQVYNDRRDRRTHPDGHTDNGGRWYPSKAESQPCCRGIRGPSRSYPWSLMLHCRTLTHVANLYDVDLADLRQAGRKSPAREGGDHYYKAVAVADDGRWLSIYDGETEYRIGETLSQRPGQRHTGGYYVYASMRDAQDAAVPGNSILEDAQRVILRVRAEGSYCRYDNHKLSFSRVTPLEAIEDWDTD
jgi:hypothetical protein